MRIVPLLFLLLFITGSDDRKHLFPFSYFAEENIPELSEQEKNALDEYIKQNYSDNKPGIEILVCREQQELYHVSTGIASVNNKIPLRKNLIFEIGSVTKLFTAVAVLKLIDEGKLTLNDSLSGYYPEYPNSRNIKIKHLLSHTSGIPDYAIHFMEKNIKDHFDDGFKKKTFFRNISRTNITEYLKIHYDEKNPGSKWEYSNGGYYYLGLIIEKVSGKSYFSFIKEEIIDPLQLVHTTFKDPGSLKDTAYATGHFYTKDSSEGIPKHYPTFYLPNDYAFSAGGLNSTLKDLYRFYHQVVQGKIVDNQMLQKAWKPYKLENKKTAGCGFGWFIHKKHDKKIICHPGCTIGFSTITHYIPEDDLFIGVYTNHNSQEFNISSNNIEMVNKVFSYLYK
jgi:CubicO group peptidase (beta-lactamase class C family)